MFNNETESTDSSEIDTCVIFSELLDALVGLRSWSGLGLGVGVESRCAGWPPIMVRVRVRSRGRVCMRWLASDHGQG